VFAYGWSQVRGCNAGFLSLIWPFASAGFNGCQPDSGGSSNPPAAYNSTTNPVTAPPPGTAGAAPITSGSGPGQARDYPSGLGKLGPGGYVKGKGFLFPKGTPPPGTPGSPLV
jgi:hypothetical protein